jgi:hypothetical protein
MSPQILLLLILMQEQYPPNGDKACLVCGRPLAKQARGNYCKLHRGQDPRRQLAAKKSKDKKEKQPNQ